MLDEAIHRGRLESYRQSLDQEARNNTWEARSGRSSCRLRSFAPRNAAFRVSFCTTAQVSGKGGLAPWCKLIRYWEKRHRHGACPLFDCPGNAAIRVSS